MSSTSPGESALPPGAVVAGKLRVVRTLGVGGMGTVYEVEHALTQHRRALKILHRRASLSPTVVARFQREASAAARIGNPHISETFDAGSLETGEPYILMELLEGETLDERVRRLGPLDPRELAELIHQACDGVQAAHDAGIVHRDLKPENLFVTTRDGAPFIKILDFGISKFETPSAMGVTSEGTMMGTPYYMPPEQVRGLPSIDSRADIYSLGVILYECASGVRPYLAPAIEQLALLIHEGKAVPLAQLRPALPVALCEIAHQAMAVDREQRFQTARALAEALAPLREAGGPREHAAEAARVVASRSKPPEKSFAFLPDDASAKTALADTVPSQPPASAVPAPADRTATTSPVSDTIDPTPKGERRSIVGGAAVAVIVAGLTSFLVLRGREGEPGSVMPTNAAAAASASPGPSVSVAPSATVAAQPSASAVTSASATVTARVVPAASPKATPASSLAARSTTTPPDHALAGPAPSSPAAPRHCDPPIWLDDKGHSHLKEGCD